MTEDHFKKYLSDCPQREIRCLWFHDGRIGVGMVMTLDLREGMVVTEREVFNHARQNSQTREMSHQQVVIATELLPKLPESQKDVAFADGLHLSFWLGEKHHIVSYSRAKMPLLVRRLYDVGGGSSDFVYEK